MREIKFRAYDEISKSIIEWNELIGLKNNLRLQVLSNTESNLKWMQYTGLKDKNGREIYEGDICTRYHLKGVVVYHNERSMFVLQDGFNEPLSREVYGLEIIGNIHENPELI